jgi:predicted amidohydrolase YtcJ
MKVFFGRFLTLEREFPLAFGVAVSQDGLICDLLFRVADEDLFLKKWNVVSPVRLSAFVLPGFVDPHSHLIGTGRHRGCCNLHGCESVEALISRLQSFCQTNPGDDVVLGVQYDDTLMAEMRHPHKTELDRLQGRKVLITHVSGHVGVASTSLLGTLQSTELIDAESGLLKEAALFSMLARTGKSVNSVKGVDLVCREYSSHGITTACEAWFLQSDLTALNALSRLQLVVFPICMDVRKVDQTVALARRIRHPNVICGGVKLVFDGSIQAKTAALSLPYHHDHGFCGKTSYSQGEFLSCLIKVFFCSYWIASS